MKTSKHSVTILMLLFLFSFETISVAQTNVNQGSESVKPKTGLGITLLGGVCLTQVTAKDSYFGTKDKSSQMYSNAGLGFILDLPLSMKTRLWINPELMLIGLKNPFISLNITLQRYLSKSFFILGGASVAVDDFKYPGLGGSLGIGIKPAQRISLIIQNRMSYYKLHESTPLVKYTAMQIPVSLVLRFDIASTVRKVRPVEMPAVKDVPQEVKPVPVKPVEKPKETIQQNAAPVPVKPVEEPKVIIQQNEKPAPVKAADVSKNTDNQLTDLTKMDSTELKVLLKKSIKEQNADEASRILDEIHKRDPANEFKSSTYIDLTNLQKAAIKAEDYVKAQKIQDEITRRETSGNLSEIPVGRLDEMLKEAVKIEDYEKAAKIQAEIDKRKK